MDSFGIGLSGLSAAQKAFEIIGNNIANAATDGYHRQNINLTPAFSSRSARSFWAEAWTSRASPNDRRPFTEEMFKQYSLSEQVSQELATLRMVENAFGELSGRTGLSTAIDEFFNALQDLSAHPAEAIWQSQAVTAAETMTSQFRTMGDFISSLESQIKLETENALEEVNALIVRIADLNDTIKRHEIGGGRPTI